MGQTVGKSNQRVSIKDGCCLSINVGMSASVEELVSLHDGERISLVFVVSLVCIPNRLGNKSV